MLQEEGFVVDTCSTGTSALEQLRSGLYEIVILDWMLPDLDGLSLCRKLRDLGQTLPVLMLTARKDVREIVLGLEAGADDYLVKPFEAAELLARMRALLRRRGTQLQLRAGDLVLDVSHRRAQLAGSPMNLTTREFHFLAYLMRRASDAVPRTELLAQVWEIRQEPASNPVEATVSRVREKLGDHAWMLETVRGYGYRLRDKRPSGAATAGCDMR